jgi:uncharacterized membrane protein (UPF0127 family)
MCLSWRAALAAILLFVLPALALGQELAPLVVGTQAGPQSFEVEIADDPAERARGLMFRRSMAPERGMLFDFGSDQPVSFWMRNTYIPLDMIFIRADGSVDSIAERTTPLSERSVRSKGPVRYVLEINAGLSRQLGIRAGDPVSGAGIAAQ